MKMARPALVVLLWLMSLVCVSARSTMMGTGHDDVLMQASTGERWVGHQQSERSFISCSGVPIAITQGDKILHGASCDMQRAALRFGVQRGISTYASVEGEGLIKLNEVVSAYKYALASWTGEAGKRGRAVLVNDGTAWHVLSFGKINQKEILARGVPRDILTGLLGASP
jgi:hypothetical protein